MDTEEQAVKTRAPRAPLHYEAYKVDLDRDVLVPILGTSSPTQTETEDQLKIVVSEEDFDTGGDIAIVRIAKTIRVRVATERRVKLETA